MTLFKNSFLSLLFVGLIALMLGYEWIDGKPYLLGYAWREGKVTTQKVISYLDSSDFWRRRIPIVATVSLNQKARGGVGDARRTLEICELVVEDHVDILNKALSWALRELAKRDREPVIEFIKKYEGQLHARVLREVKTKLITGTKN